MMAIVDNKKQPSFQTNINLQQTEKTFLYSSSQLVRYWNIYCISPKSEGVGYKHSPVPTAQKFIQQLAANFPARDIQDRLLFYFNPNKSHVDLSTRAQAGLCLRAYVSAAILQACKKIANLFGGEKRFTYHDLLPFVLNDDGKTPIVLDKDQKTQLVLKQNGEVYTWAHNFFSVKILQTYNPDSESRMSLDNWVYLQTKQHPEIKAFLSELGFKDLSDWALLNKAGAKQMERLSVRDRLLVEAFHRVYRRDRVQQHSRRSRRCPDPSSSQLQEMLTYLQSKGIIINTTIKLMKELKQVAIQLRQYDIWNSKEPLEVQDPHTGYHTLRPDLPTNSQDEVDIEQQELLDFLRDSLQWALCNAIRQEIGACITRLEKSKHYAKFAKQFIPGLQLYYCQKMSLKDIVPKLGMTTWDQARRVLNPGELLCKVRTLTVQQLLERILQIAAQKGLTQLPPHPDYCKTLVEEIEAYVDEEIFTEAAEEIRAGKNRMLNSAYAQQLRLYLRLGMAHGA